MKLLLSLLLFASSLYAQVNVPADLSVISEGPGVAFAVTALAAEASPSARVRWLDPAIDCGSDHYPSHVNPFNVYAQMTDVLKKRRPDGVLFFSVNIIFGFCSFSERAFVPEGGRNLSVAGIESWPWKKFPFVKEVRASLLTNVEGVNYNKLEIRVDEALTAAQLAKKDKVSVTVGYHDVRMQGVRVKWIFEETAEGLKARIEAI